MNFWTSIIGTILRTKCKCLVVFESQDNQNDLVLIPSINTFYFSSLSWHSHALKFNMLMELKFYHVWDKACSHTILRFCIKEQTTNSPCEFCNCWYLGTTIKQSKQMTFLLGFPPLCIEHYTFFGDNTGIKFKGIYVESFYDSTIEIIPQ